MKNVERVTVFQVAKRRGKPDRVLVMIEYGLWENADVTLCYFEKSNKLPVDKLDHLVAEENEMRAWTKAHPGKFNLCAFLIHKMGR